MIALVATAAGATFLTALAASPHCALMCGPLACAGITGDPRTRHRAAAAWHAGRAFAYTALGALLGALGHRGLALAQAPVARALPWLMAAGLVLSAFEVGRRLPALPGLARLPGLFARLGAAVPPLSRAALRGAATPFLPCGLLYGGFVVALGAGSAGAGGAVMLAFALGAVPALVFVQANAGRLAARPRTRLVARRLLPLVGAAVLIWRALGTTGVAPPCHHAADQTLEENRPTLVAR